VKRVYVIVEGATEESFVKGPLAEALWPRSVLLTPIILGVPGHKGGRTNYARVRKDLLRQLKQDPGAHCSTMIDFYALGDGYPGTPTPEGMSQIDKVRRIERAIQNDIRREIPELRPDLRMIPYLSLHEYESLLFSDPAAFAEALRRPDLAARLQGVREHFPTPEDINDGPQTAPQNAWLPSVRPTGKSSTARSPRSRSALSRCEANARISAIGSSDWNLCQTSESACCAQTPSRNRSTHVFR
jgi:hypothetical protein